MLTYLFSVLVIIIVTTAFLSYSDYKDEIRDRDCNE